jgi:NADH-quinone oxidoreductase subunit G
VADVPIYFADPLVRRSPNLQRTVDAKPPAALFSAATMTVLGLEEGDRVRLRQAGGEATLVARRDDRIAAGAVHVSAAHPSTATLPMMFGEISAEKVADDVDAGELELAGQQA